jgi:hypothetical protein
MPHLGRLDSTISLAPSTGVPSECGTPNSETAAGMGGHGISDYVILKEAGKGAYGLVMRAKVKGPRGEPIGVNAILNNTEVVHHQGAYPSRLLEEVSPLILSLNMANL